MNLELAKEALKKYFGYDAFRPMQAEIIQTIYDGRDVVVLMPTGGGKSMCFQIPAITLEGTAIVVSPLISLMRDQVEGLRSNGVKAAFLNSTLSAAAQRQVEDQLFRSELDLLYVSPEKMVSREFIPLLTKAKVSLFAIDEAHCISAWGHDFRKEYSRLQFLKKQFPHVPIVALTATADKLTRKDIVQQMAMKDPAVFISSFDRPNLSLEVRSGQKRLEQIARFIADRPEESGIIYCLSRKSTEQLCTKLAKRGVNVAFYHAGMPDFERSRVQDAFIQDEITVVCATVAFGMGIDKSNVRWVIHYNLPQNVESYYQEIGRAGRDGVEADTLLFYSYADLSLLKEILGKSESDQAAFKLAKLERMYQFASGQICRRKMLLSYFGEDLKEDCGNCDICNNPPEYFDGTVLTQKALSAIARTRESIGMNLLIDVLRGSGKREIFELGLHQIKTYGAGREYSYLAWRQYLEQMLNQGLFEIAHDDGNKIKLTPASKEVLFEGRKVQLVKFEVLKKRQEEAKKNVPPAKLTLKEQLFEVLRQVRRRLAQQNGFAPYQVFSDATLREMTDKKPVTDPEMRQISGVGERKLFLYGDAFLEAIRSFIQEKSAEGVRVQGGSHIVTYGLYQKGFSPEEIAKQRTLKLSTIYGHLALMYEKGEVFDIFKLVSGDEVQSVLDVLPQLEEPYQLKPVHDRLKGQLSYEKIRLALAVYYRDQPVSD